MTGPSKRLAVLVVACLFVVAAAGAAVNASSFPPGAGGKGVWALDRAAAEWARRVAPEGSPAWKVSRIVTELGGPAGIAAALVTIGSANRQAGEEAFSALVYAGAVTYAVKALSGRARPGRGDVGFFGPSLSPGLDSFPSGHTAAAFAVAAVAARHHPRYAEELFAAALAVGVSRIILGEHWATDVLAGAALGALAADRVASGRWAIVWQW